MRVPRRRVEAWLDALARAEATAGRLASKLGRVTVVLHGSYARGDFNVWSDIDLIVVSEAFEGVRFLDRYDLIMDALDPGVEAIPVTPREIEAMLSKPAWRQALARGSVIVRDDHGLAPAIERATGTRPPGLQQFRQRVQELLRDAVEA